MGVTSYELDGKTYWQAYVNVVSNKNRKIREQKRVPDLASKDEAEKVYKREYQQACIRLARRENEGASWEEVVEKWEHYYTVFPSEKLKADTIRDYVARANNWTKSWLKKPASSLGFADGAEIFQLAKAEGASLNLQYQLKIAIKVIYTWGIEHGHIVGRDKTPVQAIELERKSSSTIPEILTRDQVIALLEKAEAQEHPWFPVWKVDLYTGMRAGELKGLRLEDIDLVSREVALGLDKSTSHQKNYGLIRVHRAWCQKIKDYSDTKGGYWRTVPVSSELYWFLQSYLPNANWGKDKHGTLVFQDFKELRRGMQAKVLRAFCETHKLKSIKFHTLRACFATHLIQAGVPASTVMKIGGWQDLETMQIYIRMAGIEEAGATEKLSFKAKAIEVPRELPQNVVSLFGR
ncbi:MAG: tyrosine-type recombinase/integrase [Pseudobdellovibrionaceae bacterium]